MTSKLSLCFYIMCFWFKVYSTHSIQGMMIDEADEFVSGPQNKHKRPGEPNMQGIPKRRRCMSPLLRGRPQTPPVVNNHIGGKGPPIPTTQAQPDLVKPIPIHKSK